MGHSFRPYPVVAIVKLFVVAIAVSAMLLIIRDSISQILLDLLGLTWLVALFYMLVAYLQSRFHVIELQDQVINYNAGLISTKNIVIPYGRVMEASYTQSLVQRLFGVGNLIVDTAGSGNAAIRLYDVKYSDLKAILAEINTKSGKDSGL